MISKPYPRKGTETTHTLSIPMMLLHQFQNHIPARGRKRQESDVNAAVTRISKPYPRKGTETPSISNVPSAWEMKDISKPYPRKGTETEVEQSGTIFGYIISKPYPRKGTETALTLLFRFPT